MNYREAIRWIIDRAGYEKGFVANPFVGDDVAALGLRRTAALLDGLNNPEQSYPIVHIAGTKGKGSVSATVEALARSAGKRTGLYVTPHLHTFRERIQIDAQPVDEAEFAALADALEPVDQAVRESQPEIGEPTAFEVATAMALLAFARAEVDAAVVEVGMGGRLDATNVVTPVVSAITSISLDHVAILGTTLSEIAVEKGGIIKPQRPVVVGPQQAEALVTLERIAAERDALLLRWDVDWQTGLDGHGARLAGPWGDWRNVELALAGPHQVENAGTALMAAWQLDPTILADEDRVRATLASVRWPGRFERVGSTPDIYVDGAHNADSIARLVETVASRISRPPIVILGISRDKDLDGMLAELAPLQPRLIATASHNPRAAEPARIIEAAASLGMAAEDGGDVDTALARARAEAAPDDLIVVTGSLYAVAEAREALSLAETPTYERALLYT